MWPHLASRILLILAVSTVFVHVSAFDCKNIVSGRGSTSLDLSHIFANGPLNVTFEEDTPPSTTITTVTLDLCKPLKLDPSIDPLDQCPENTNVCKIVKNRRGTSERVERVIPAGTSVGGNLRADTRIPDTRPIRSLSLLIRGLDWANVTQSTTLTINCSSKNTRPGKLSYGRQAGGILYLDLTIPDECPRYVLHRFMKRRGFLSSLFWVIAIVVGLYLGIGVWYNYSHYGSNGWDLLPHRDFWREVPYMAQDAFRHVRRTMSEPYSVSGMGRAGYEPV